MADSDEIDSTTTKMTMPLPEVPEEEDSPLIASNPHCPHQQQHPLLIEDILDKIFPYFDDPPNLTSFRLVCKTWKKSASRTVKKNLRWKIGPTLHSEYRFMDVMSKCTDDMFGSLLWTHNEKTPNMNSCRTLSSAGAENHGVLRRSSRRHHLGENWHEHVNTFLERFGTQIVNLELRARDPVYLENRLQSSYLPNLEHLELYDVSEALMATKSFARIKCFPKLKSISLNPKVFHYDDEVRYFDEDKGIICDALLEAAASQLKELEINLPKTNRRFLNEPTALAVTAFSALISYKNSPPESEDSHALVVLGRMEFQNLLKNCPNLKILCTTISHRVKQDVICEILSKSKVSAQLEELHLTIYEDLEFDDEDDSDSDDTDSSESDSSQTSTDVTTSEDEDEAEVHPAEKKLAVDNIAAIVEAAANKHKKGQVVFTLKRRASSYPRQAPPAKMKGKPDGNGDGKKKRNPFPEMPKLKQLGLHFWRLRNFDIFYNKPHLVKVDLVLNNSGSAVRLFTPLLVENLGVKYLRCRDSYQDVLIEDGIEKFSELFPNLEELDVKLEDDHTLEAIFMHMPQLKRLNLNDSIISDEGITGLPIRKLKDAFEKWLTLDDMNDAPGSYCRERSYIGCLKDLQQFTYTGHSLTKYSIHYGIAALRNLTNLKLSPRRVTNYGKWTFGSYSCRSEPVDIRHLLANCKYLVKLDVNEVTGSDDEDADFTDDSDVEENPIKPEFKGCGLKNYQIKLVKECFPQLELVYGEKASPS